MPFGSDFEEIVQQPSDLQKVGDEAVVEVGETLKCTILCDIGRDLPFPNTGNLDQVHHDRAIFKNHAKELNPSCLENAFAWFQEQVQLL